MKAKIYTIVLIMISVATAEKAHAQSGGRFTVARSVVACGGATAATGGTFTLNSTVAQSAAGLPTSTRYSVQSGYWIMPTFLIFAPAKTGNSFNLSFETTPGRTYIVEFTDSLSNPNWQPLPGINGDGTVKSVNDSAPGIINRYYRIREQ